MRGHDDKFGSTHSDNFVMGLELILSLIHSLKIIYQNLETRGNEQHHIYLLQY